MADEDDSFAGPESLESVLRRDEEIDFESSSGPEARDMTVW